MRNSPVSCKPPPHSNWRDDCKTCPVCGEKYWPTKNTKRNHWEVQVHCTNACSATMKSRNKQLKTKNEKPKSNR